MRIGILQTGQAPDVLKPTTGDYPEMFERLLGGKDFTFRTYHVEMMDFPETVHDCDGWLITGSRHGVYEDHPFIPKLEQFIRDAMAENVPVVGICFGHQIIAQALGGKVERYQGGWAVGPQEYDFGKDKIVMNAWHRDQVVEKPEGAEVLASNEFCDNAALLYGDKAFSVQAHPEFRDDYIDGLLRTRGPGLVPDDLMQGARDKMGKKNDSGSVAGMIAEFFHKAEKPKGNRSHS